MTAPQFFHAYLFAFVFWIGLPLGSLCVLMIHHLTGGGWGLPIRRFLEASISTLPLVGLLFVPLFFGLHHLYPWTNPGIVAQDAALQKKQLYLNVPAFTARAILSFFVWIVLASLLRRWSAEQSRTSDPAPTRRLRTLSGPGLVVFALTVSVAVVDWLMVLERDWYSTVFPAQVIVGQILVTLAFCVFMLPATVDIEHFHALGNLLLAFVMMWAYLALSQLIVIWSGNLPHEITWYTHRVAGGWRWVAVFLGLFHFALPFCLLLSREFKKDARFLRKLALGIMIVHAIEVLWQVEPSLHRTGLYLPWLDLAAFLLVGAVWTAFLRRQLPSRAN